MILCKKCGYEGPYEGQCCPECNERYSLTEGEVRAILEQTHTARERREMETVVENYRMLTDFGVPEAEREYARVLESEGAWDKAAALYRRAAAAGDATGAYRFALCNPELDEVARRFWLCYAAILGCRESYFLTAETMKMAGEEKIATHFYTLAAEGDDVGAIVMLARRYADGEGCEKNEGYAKWYLDRLTLPPIHALRLAYRLRGVAAEEPPMPARDFYDDFLKGLRADAERFGFRGAQKYLAELLMGRGDVESTMRVATLSLEDAEHTQGIVKQKNVEAGLSALNLAASLGCAEAYLMLGNISRYGTYGVPINMQNAIEMYTKAAELSSGDAYLVLAEMHMSERGGRRNIPLAIRLYEEGAKCGSDEAFRRASMLKDQREAAYHSGIRRLSTDPEGAMRDFAESVNMGYRPAQVKLGDCYLMGIATKGKPDRKTAFRWYKSAYELSVDEAIYPLALCYSRGVGTAADPGRAISLLRRGVALGQKRCEPELTKLCARRAKKSLRSMYSQATALLHQHKFDEAFRLLTELSRMNVPVAVYYLGACYEFAIGTPTDRPLAYVLYKRATSLGFDDKRAKSKADFLRLIKR